MKWLVAWLIFNAMVFVWRLLVTLPRTKTEFARAKRPAAITDRA
jgi:hypothetical protein